MMRIKIAGVPLRNQKGYRGLCAVSVLRYEEREVRNKRGQSREKTICWTPTHRDVITQLTPCFFHPGQPNALAACW